MTDAPTEAPATLTPFDGRQVLNTTVAIRNAGDGLSNAMKVSPVELHHGDKIYVVIECDVEKVRFDPIKDTDALQRVHMLKAGTATIVDEDLVRSHLDDMERRIEAHAGITRLPFDDEDEDTAALRAEHEDDQHDPDEPREGCPLCPTEDPDAD